MYKNNTKVIYSVHKHIVHIQFHHEQSKQCGITHISPERERERERDGLGRHEVREQRNRILCYIYHINSHSMTDENRKKRQNDVESNFAHVHRVAQIVHVT